MKPRLQTSLGQQLVLTPQLRQAIRLLQLSTLELEAEIAEAVETNPLLDWAESEPMPRPRRRAMTPRRRRRRRGRRRDDAGRSATTPGTRDERTVAGARRRASTATTTTAMPPSACAADRDPARPPALAVAPEPLSPRDRAHRRGADRCDRRRRLPARDPRAIAESLLPELDADADEILHRAAPDAALRSGRRGRARPGRMPAPAARRCCPTTPRASALAQRIADRAASNACRRSASKAWRAELRLRPRTTPKRLAAAALAGPAPRRADRRDCQPDTYVTPGLRDLAPAGRLARGAGRRPTPRHRRSTAATNR